MELQDIVSNPAVWIFAATSVGGAYMLGDIASRLSMRYRGMRDNKKLREVFETNEGRDHYESTSFERDVP